MLNSFDNWGFEYVDFYEGFDIIYIYLKLHMYNNLNLTEWIVIEKPLECMLSLSNAETFGLLDHTKPNA